MYEWPQQKSFLNNKLCVLLRVRTPLKNQYDRLGHLSSYVLQKIKSMFLLVSSYVSFSHCYLCFNNKSHKPHFSEYFLISHGLLDLVYSDVWGPSLIFFYQLFQILCYIYWPSLNVSINNFKYYIIFIDHFTKYIWLCSIYFKYDVMRVITMFKTLIKACFKTNLITQYSYLEREHQKLKSYLYIRGFNILLHLHILLNIMSQPNIITIIL